MKVSPKGLQVRVKRLKSGGFASYAYASVGGTKLCQAHGATRAEALSNIQRLLRSPAVLAKFAERPAIVAAGKHTVGEVVTRYFESAAFKHRTEATKTAYRAYLNLFRERFHEFPMDALAQPEGRRLLAEWWESYAHTVRKANYIRAAVVRLYNWATPRGYCISNPMSDLEGVKMEGAKAKGRSHIVWSDEEIERVKAAAGTPELRWAIDLALATGLRQGDLIRLPWSAVERKHIVLAASKTGELVSIPRDAIEPILAQIARRCPVVLTSSLGKPWTADGLRASFDKAKRRAGIIDRHWHDFRGTAFTRLMEQGLDSVTLALWFGWSLTRVETMERVYGSRTSLADARRLGTKKKR